MRPSLIIPRLRAQVAALSNRVGGAVDFEAAQLAEQLACPAAFVFPTLLQPEANQLIGGVAQDVTEGFSVALVIDNTADERGADSAEAMHDLHEDVLAALVGWQPGSGFGRIEWAGTEISPPDRARLWAELRFIVTSSINS